ncbi:MAG TPA: hypothetical protein PLM24_05805, partial [Methanothrix sp.]|nr:hypothetical protein [Methanothrix sp.]
SSTMAISSSVNPRSSRTRESICRSVAIDLPLEEGLLVAGLRLRKPPVQVEHVLDEAYHRRRVAGEVHRGYNSYIELLK